MACVKICYGVSQPPVELTRHLERLLEVLRRGVRISGKVVKQTELVIFERRQTVELIELSQRRVGARKIACCHARPGAGEWAK